MSKINYVLAKDEDFIKNKYGNFVYVKEEPYVEIPHTIQGVHIRSYTRMFYRNCSVRGIKSTNKDVTQASAMFLDCSGQGDINLSEFDMTNIIDASNMFTRASFKNIVWPKDKMPLQLKSMMRMFQQFKTTTLDLSVFNVSHIKMASEFLQGIKADKVIFPTKNLEYLLITYDPLMRDPLKLISSKFHTEELCWAAVLINRECVKHVKIKSKRILMYLGTEYPEYVKFYYNETVI